MNLIRRNPLQVIGAIVAIVYLLVGIFNSTNSTAAVGFVFLPVAAAIGAFVGDSLKYLIDIARRKRAPSTGKSLLIFLAAFWFVLEVVKAQVHHRDMALAQSPNTSAETLNHLVEKNNPEVTRALVLNPSLPEQTFKQILENNFYDYYILSAVAERPNLKLSDMKQLVSVEPKDFKDQYEYDSYETFVWAKLAKRKDLPEDLIHQLAAKKNPSHFLILALLDSPFVTCKEKQNFLPQPNHVLESSIFNSMKSQNCPSLQESAESTSK